MANEVHVRILLAGREHWQFARSQRPDTVPDFSGANLSRANLVGFDLTGANLKEANLSGADLRLVNFSERYPSTGADLSGANLSGANLKGAWVDGANFSGCDLRGADLSTVRGLTAEQIALAVMDETTKLPLYLIF